MEISSVTFTFYIDRSNISHRQIYFLSSFLQWMRFNLYAFLLHLMHKNICSASNIRILQFKNTHFVQIYRNIYYPMHGINIYIILKSMHHEYLITYLVLHTFWNCRPENTLYFQGETQEANLFKNLENAVRSIQRRTSSI